MKFLMILLTVLFMSTAYANVDCGKNEKLVNLTTRTVAITLNCKNEQSLREDVDKLAVKLGLCRGMEQDKGIICTVVAKGGVYMVQKQIPRRWMCKPDIAMKVLEAGLNKTCVALTGL